MERPTDFARSKAIYRKLHTFTKVEAILNQTHRNWLVLLTG